MRSEMAYAASVLVLALVVCGVTPSTARADYYDDFSDGSFWQNEANTVWYQGNPIPPFDPNFWDIDNSHWTFYPALASNGAAQIVETEDVDKALRLFGDFNFVLPVILFMAAMVDDGIQDPNTSATYWDDTSNHYLLTKVYYPGNHNGGDPNDPNDDKGSAYIFLHADENLWQLLNLEFSFHNCAYIPPGQPYSWPTHKHYTHHIQLVSINGTSGKNMVRVWIDPNGCRAVGSIDPNTSDPNDTTWLEPPEPLDQRDPNYDDTKWLGVNLDQWERQGFWALLQFEQDPNYASGDPNGKFLRAAIWFGDKYDWDGQWLLSHELSKPYWNNQDPNGWYWAEGKSGVACASFSPAAYGNGGPADLGYDDIEARTGVFSNNPRTLALTLKDSTKGSVSIDPNLMHPSQDANDPDHLLRRYTDGTEIVLVATPVPGKGWRAWKVYDPNHPGDANYVTEDSNTVLYLTMDADYEVEAVFKCGSSDMIPPVGAVLLALTGCLLVRRFT